MEALFSHISRPPLNKVVIVGNGAAGMEAARLIREKNPAVQITVFSREPYHFYSRIHLSTFIGEENAADKIQIFPTQWYEKQQISVNLDNPVTSIEPGKKRVTDRGGNKYPYDKLILATGASPVIPPFRGVKTEGIFSLRNLQDALSIRSCARNRDTAVVIGGGILGIEAASSLNKIGLTVTIIELADHLLPSQLNAEGAAVLQSILEKRGITIRLASAVKSLQGKLRVNSVMLSDRTIFPAEMVLISAGVIPNTQLAQTAAIKVNRGIIVNNQMETSIGNMYAAGDVIEFNGNLWGIWPAAVDQGMVAGTAVAGLPVTYTGTTPLHILKVSGTELTTVGKRYAQSAHEEEILHTNPPQEYCLKLIHNSRTLLGAVVLGIPGIGFRLEKLIRQQTPISDILPDLKKGHWDVLKQKR